SSARAAGDSPAPAARPAEVRAIWITRWDFKEEADLRRAVRWCVGLGLNRILLQVRGRADALYRSSHEPWAEELGGADPGYDPLAVAVEEARAHSVELHAWINVLPAWKGDGDPSSPDHVLYKHPEWFLVDRLGKRLLKHPSDYTILNPCLPEVRAHLVEVAKDIAGRYAIDGLHLDYVRFVGRDARRGADFPYDPRSLSLFRSFSGSYPTDAPEEWDRWRGLAVDSVVFRMAEAARKARPGIRISVAAIEDYERAREGLFQDVVKWQEAGWVEDVYPMTYHRGPADFLARARPALERGARGRVIPGIGAFLHGSAAETRRQVDLARGLRAGGYAVFAYSSLFPSPSPECGADAEAKALRSELRTAVLELNGGPRRARLPRPTETADLPRA
ncbi:MAG: family 10 glycosylhydrolase, partial [Planctomycetes bacterium]|nr:family 10 glycosylhydrolase [Planctomycetota bacterium]